MAHIHLTFDADSFPSWEGSVLQDIEDALANCFGGIELDDVQIYEDAGPDAEVLFGWSSSRV